MLKTPYGYPPPPPPPGAVPPPPGAIPYPGAVPPLPGAVPPLPGAVPPPGVVPPTPWDRNGNTIPDVLEPGFGYPPPGAVPPPPPPRHYRSPAERRAHAIESIRRDEAARQREIDRLNAIKSSLAVKQAAEEAKAQAYKDAERDYQLREKDLIERQLHEASHTNREMTRQYQHFVNTTDEILQRLAQPAKLIPHATIQNVQEFEDYYKFDYKDGRVLYIPTGVVSRIIDSFIGVLREKVRALEAESHAQSIRIQNAEAAIADQTTVINKFIENATAEIAAIANRVDDAKTELNTAIDRLQVTVDDNYNALNDRLSVLES